MTLKITTALYLLFASICMATETTLYYYKADNKTADAVIDAIDTNRFQYHQVEAQLMKVAKSGKLKLLKKSVLTEDEMNITADTSSMRINGEEVPLGLSIRAASYEMRGAYVLAIDSEYNEKVKSKQYTNKRAILDGSLPAKSWVVAGKWRNERDTDFILVQTTNKEAEPAQGLTAKKPSYSCHYRLVEANERILKEYLKASQNENSNAKEKALNILLNKAKVIQAATMISSSGSKSVLSDSLMWIKKDESAQLGFSVEQEIQINQGDGEQSLLTSISWSDDSKFKLTPDYTFKEKILIADNKSAVLLPLTKAAKSLALVLTIKKL